MMGPWSSAAAMPRSRAKARPGASGRLLTTAAMRAFQPSAAQARTMASMFEPRPEMRITMFFMGGESVAATYNRHPHTRAHDEPASPTCRPPPARAVRHAARRRAAPRALPRCAHELGARAGGLRGVLLRRRLARAHHALRRPRDDREDRIR